MTSSFRTYDIDGVRYDAGTMDKGRYVPGATSPITFSASVQPLSGAEKATLPEGIRERESYRLYTDFELHTSNEKEKKKADRIVLFNKTFEIVRANIWQNKVIPHYKAIASLIDA